jgi:hypothetical protein
LANMALKHEFIVIKGRGGDIIAKFAKFDHGIYIMSIFIF